tara:strand:+ start:1044 stop:1883 length:840 start_codon:yes stop_codon:yes gene_type:complete
MFGKITHIATKAEVHIKVTLEYKIKAKQRRLVREIAKRFVKIGGNEFDVAIYFMISQLDLLSVSDDTKQFISSKIALIREIIQFSCLAEELEYDLLIISIERTHGLKIASNLARERSAGDTTTLADFQADEMLNSETSTLPEKHASSNLKAVSEVVEAEIETDLLSDKTAVFDTPADPDKKFYLEAYLEIEENNIEKGVWAISLSKSGGEREKTESIYITLRSRELQERNKIEEQMAKNDISDSGVATVKLKKKSGYKFSRLILVVILIIFLFWYFLPH